MKKLPLRNLLGLGVSLVVLLAAGKWAYDDWPLWSNTKADPRAFQFLKNVRKVARHGDLTDVKYIEEMLGVTFKLIRTDVANDNPKTTWEKDYLYVIEKPSFPLRNKHVTDNSFEAGNFSFTQPKQGKGASGYLQLNLSSGISEKCLTMGDVAEIFGSTSETHPVTDGVPVVTNDFVFNGKNITVVIFFFDMVNSGCLSHISMSQNK